VFKSGFGVALIIIWVIGSMFGAIMELQMSVSTGGNSGSALQGFFDEGSNIETIKIDTPAAGGSSNPISTVLDYGHIAAGAVAQLARAAVWDFAFFEGWGQIIRALFFGVSTIYIISAMVEITAPLSFLITSLGNAASGILNAFLGRI
jgi:hypothetical protein